jgi:Fe-S-cluster containining protein
MNSGDFLKKYCVQYNGQETGLPVVSLKPDYKNELSCPFVSDSGCKVYKDRPASCRLYPLARMASRNRETGKITEYFALIKEEHCKGFERGKEYTPQDWIKEQRAEEYNRINDEMIEIIGISRGIEPAAFEDSMKEIFVMACYDIDMFKKFISEDDFKNNEIAKSLGYKEEIFKDNEIALLLFGLEYIKGVFLRIGKA